MPRLKPFKNEMREKSFQEWFAKRVSFLEGLTGKKFAASGRDPDSPLQFFDHRSAFIAKNPPEGNKTGHLPSKFKLPGHPNLFVEGINTATREQATVQDIQDNEIVRKGVTRIVEMQRRKQEL